MTQHECEETWRPAESFPTDSYRYWMLVLVLVLMLVLVLVMVVRLLVVVVIVIMRLNSGLDWRDDGWMAYI